MCCLSGLGTITNFYIAVRSFGFYERFLSLFSLLYLLLVFYGLNLPTDDCLLVVEIEEPPGRGSRGLSSSLYVNLVLVSSIMKLLIMR